ncbi:MAG TPA: acyltransferase [Alphaproteobacteria bacterium]
MERSREIKALTGLRAVAAFWVVLFHLNNDLVALDPGVAAFVRMLAPAGYLGVDLFFILSGFVISYTYADRLRVFESHAYLRFLWARLARIYPVHLFTLGILLALVALGLDGGHPRETTRYSAERFIDNLLLVHGWALPIEKSWNVPSWSISTEWLAYLAFPLVSAAALAIRHRRAIVLACATLCAVTVVAFATFRFQGTMAYGLVRIGVDFSIGCLLFGLYRQQAFRSLALGVGLAAAYLCTLVGVLIVFDVRIAVAACAPAPLAMLVYGLSADRGAVCRWLAKPAVLYWGRASYSLYMTHLVVVWILHSYVTPPELAQYPPTLRAAVMTGLVAAILGAAAFTYRWIEQPSRRWMLRRFAPIEAASVTASPRPQTAPNG